MSFQNEKPPARVNLTLEVQQGDARRQVELPLRMLVVGGFSGRRPDAPVEERHPVSITKDNFDGVLRSMDVRAEVTVPDRLRGGDAELSATLRFSSLDDFHPERLVRQIPALGRLVAARALLQDLRNRVITAAQFRAALQSVVRDPDALRRLTSELRQLSPGDAPGGPA